MLNVRDYSEGWKHQKLNTPNCPITFVRHYLYVYLSFSVLAMQLVNQFGVSSIPELQFNRVERLSITKLLFLDSSFISPISFHCLS
jgi:hypothetical protein